MTEVVQVPWVRFAGSGTRGPFPLVDDNGATITYRAKSEIVVTRYSSVGAAEALVEGADYALSQISVSTGGTAATITLDNSQPVLAVGQKLVAERVTPLAQTQQFQVAGGFSSQSTQETVDRLQRQVQDLEAMIRRSLRVHPTAQAPGLFSAPSSLKGKLLGGNPTTGEIEPLTIDTGSNAQIIGEYEFEGDGVEASFELTGVFLSSAVGILAWVGGSVQPTQNYTLTPHDTGTTLTFSAPPADESDILVRAVGYKSSVAGDSIVQASGGSILTLADWVSLLEAATHRATNLIETSDARDAITAAITDGETGEILLSAGEFIVPVSSASNQTIFTLTSPLRIRGRGKRVTTLVFDVTADPTAAATITAFAIQSAGVSFEDMTIKWRFTGGRNPLLVCQLALWNTAAADDFMMRNVRYDGDVNSASSVYKFDVETGDINTTNETLDLTAHDLYAGAPVYVRSTINGITGGTTYYVGAIAGDLVCLYDTRANAKAGGATGKLNLTGTTAFALYKAADVNIVGVNVGTSTGANSSGPAITGGRFEAVDWRNVKWPWLSVGNNVSPSFRGVMDSLWFVDNSFDNIWSVAVTLNAPDGTYKNVHVVSPIIGNFVNALGFDHFLSFSGRNCRNLVLTTPIKRGIGGDILHTEEGAENVQWIGGELIWDDCYSSLLSGAFIVPNDEEDGNSTYFADSNVLIQGVHMKYAGVSATTTKGVEISDGGASTGGAINRRMRVTGCVIEGFHYGVWEDDNTDLTIEVDSNTFRDCTVGARGSRLHAGWRDNVFVDVPTWMQATVGGVAGFQSGVIDYQDTRPLIVSPTGSVAAGCMGFRLDFTRFTAPNQTDTYLDICQRPHSIHDAQVMMEVESASGAHMTGDGGRVSYDGTTFLFQRGTHSRRATGSYVLSQSAPIGLDGTILQMHLFSSLGATLANYRASIEFRGLIRWPNS